MSGIYRRRPINPLVFPFGRQRGFDPNHPAAKGGQTSVTLAALVCDLKSFTNPQFVNTWSTTRTVNGAAGTGGTVTLDPVIGPSWVLTTALATELDYTLTTALAMTTCTLACILKITSASGQTTNGAVFGSAASLWLGLSSTQALTLETGATSTTITGPTLTNGHYYFLLISGQNAAWRFLTRDLGTGAIQTATSATSLTINANATPGFFYQTTGTPSGGNFNLAAVAVNVGSQLSMAQMQQWAADPWAFWYPPISDNRFKGGITAFAMTAATGNYTLAGENLKLLKASIDSIQSGSYALTVEQEVLKVGRKLSVQEVPYTLTGEQITALKKSIDKLQAGTYTTSSQPVLKKASLENVQEGSYALTGENETLNKGSKITSQAGSYSLAGENVTELKTSITKPQSGSYTLTDEQLTLKATRLLVPQVGGFAVNAGWPSSGLQHRWPLDSADLSGGVDSDLVGTIGITENGTITAAAGPTGTTNAARSFDGTTGYGAFGSSPLPSSGAFTISLWAMTPNVSANSGTGTAQTLLNLGTNSGNQMRLVEDNGTVGGPVGGFAWATQVTNAQNAETGFAAFANNVWVHVGVTFDGASTYQTFVNGTIVGTPFNGPNNPTANDTIGAKTSASSFFDGSIAQVLIYNRALSAGEIAALYYYPTGINEQITLTLSAITSFLMNLGTGTYTLTDEQLTLLRAAKDNIQSGTYSLTGEQQKLLKTSLDNAQAGSYSLTGENETLLRKALDKAQSGFYNLTGENVSLKRGAAAFTQAGFYSLTGENVSLKWKHLEQLFAGFYNLTDESLNLTFSGTTNFSISLGTGSYVLTDETVTLLKKSDMGIQVAVYALTDEAQRLLKTNLLNAQMTPYAVDAGWPSAGLQHRWPMDLADNASGVDADVVAGDGATEVGTVTSVAGPTGTPNAARNFDGTTGYATIASSPLPSSGPYTVSVWAAVLVRAGEAGGEAPPMLNFGTNSTGNQLRFGHDNGDVNVEGGLVWWAQPGNVNKGTTAVLFSDNVWAHCAITFDGNTTYQTFFNGALISTPAGGAKPPVGFDLFASDDTTSPFLNGSLAQVMVYNRALSASEIAALYNYPEGIGEQVQLAWGHAIKAQPVFYAQTDENLVLLRALVAKAQAGLYSVSGNIGLLRRSRLSSTVGLYTLTGEALTVSTGFPSQFRLTATIRLTGTKSTTSLLGLDDISKLTGGA